MTTARNHQPSTLTLDDALASPLATITVKDAAHLAGVDRRTLAGQLSVHGGPIPARSIGRRIVIPRSAFLGWLLDAPDVAPATDVRDDEPTRDATAIIRAKLIELLGALEDVA